MRKRNRCPTCGSAVPLGWINPRLCSIPRRASEVLRVGDLVLNPATFHVSRAGRQIKLSTTGFRLLESLMRRSGQVVSKELLVHSVWASGRKVSDNLVEATIYQLRLKVDRDHKVKLIETIRNVGYVIRDPAELDRFLLNDP